ncbi:hypothetical protein DKT75_18405 [Leucothrix arctica]|uniref:Response regulatory domain-containing protein n=2 Tax=Leucothrix arctica TaxID=1481894 RepID=A0A317C705_9GAMM|nr:hypothetical protein DKT75_18405 [Leucothrix arctica]
MESLPAGQLVTTKVNDTAVQAPSPATSAHAELSSETSAIDASNEVQTAAEAVLEKAAITAVKPFVEPNPTSTEASKSYLALVIDDSAAIRKQLELELRSAGLRCDFAESGEQALEKIGGTTYDLVFLDIMMPGIDGYETCGKIRKDPRYKKTPVVMLSGKTSPLDEVKGVIAGASTYLTKPVKPDQFQRVTGRIINWLNEFR